MESLTINSTKSLMNTLPYAITVPLPDGLILPDTKKMFDIILHTCKQTRENPQLEIILKVKQEDNPLFDFLNLSNDLHAFYTYAKCLQEEDFWSLYLGKSVRNIGSDDKESEVKRTDALQLLFSEYIGDEDGEDEDEFKDENDNKSSTASSKPLFSLLNKEERLKRAKMFALQLNAKMTEGDGSKIANVIDQASDTLTSSFSKCASEMHSNNVLLETDNSMNDNKIHHKREINEHYENDSCAPPDKRKKTLKEKVRSALSTLVDKYLQEEDGR